jgi:hypothetical protein
MIPVVQEMIENPSRVLEMEKKKAELISKIFPIIDIIYGPLLEQLESKEMQRGYKATEKLNEIERGLEQYQTLMCFVDEENYNSALEKERDKLSNDNDPRRRKKSHEEIEEDAKDFADSHICQNAKTCIDRLLIRQCCKHFLIMHIGSIYLPQA